VDNSTVAEHHDRQWQKVVDEVGEKCNGLPHGSALVDAINNAPTGPCRDIRRDSNERSRIYRDDNPDKCDCSIHETLFLVQLQNAQVNLLTEPNYNSCLVFVINISP